MYLQKTNLEQVSQHYRLYHLYWWPGPITVGLAFLSFSCITVVQPWAKLITDTRKLHLFTLLYHSMA